VGEVRTFTAGAIRAVCSKGTFHKEPEGYLVCGCMLRILDDCDTEHRPETRQPMPRRIEAEMFGGSGVVIITAVCERLIEVCP
jgi:hypothetical protein